MNADRALRFDNVSGGYGQMTIVRNLSGDVRNGHCLCILGRNGVGKSTLMKILSGHLSCQDGEITLGEYAVTALSADERRKLGMS